MPPRKKKASRKPKEEHTHIVIRVDRYDVRADASINHVVYEPQYALYLDENEFVYRFDTHLEISGTAIAPDSRASGTYDLSLYGDESPSSLTNLPLKAIHERDEHEARKYRTYRGRAVPVYWVPPGLARLDKIRGESRWRVWLSARPRFVNDALMVLGQSRRVYLTIHERKAQRQRWVQNLSIQTNNPAEDE